MLKGINQNFSGNAHFSDSKFLNLQILNLNNNKLETININNLYYLKELHLSDNKLQKIDVSHNHHLQALNLSNNQINDLDVSKNNQLEKLIVKNDPTSTKILNVSVNERQRLKFARLINNNSILITQKPSQPSKIHRANHYGSIKVKKSN
jgi:Leucine-rich repeat (LRR) protein